MVFDHAQISRTGIASPAPLHIYTGILGQIGDIVMFTPTARRIKQLFPNSQITFAVSRRYCEAGELIAGLPYIDRLFVADLYFEKLTPDLYPLWEGGWPVDLRGDDEVEEQRRHDLVFETRPRFRRMPWWEYGHLVSERCYTLGIPGPVDLQTEISIPAGTEVPPEALGRIVFHNDPNISPDKAWPWPEANRLIQALGPHNFVVLGGPGPHIAGITDLRGKTTLAQAAAIIAACRCYVGIDSGLLWIASSLQVPTVALFGTSYVPSYEAGYPRNPRAKYLQTEGTLSGLTAEHVFRAVKTQV